MKTTIDLPDALLHEAKVMAAQRRTSLKALIEQGLEYVLHGESSKPENLTTQFEEDLFELDEHQVPVIKPRGVKVTEDWINCLRREEGV